MSNQVTDNDARGFSYKVSLRLESLEGFDKSIHVLDAYHGHGFIWNQVQHMTNKKIHITPIDNRTDKSEPYLKGDNEKFLMNMDLTKYDVIDVDAYGSPYKLLEIIFNSKFKGLIHGTFIQSVMGGINKALLEQLGFSKVMLAKCPTLFMKHGFDKLCAYLSLHGIGQVNYLDVGRKFYFFCWKKS